MFTDKMEWNLVIKKQNKRITNRTTLQESANQKLITKQTMKGLSVIYFSLCWRVVGDTDALFTHCCLVEVFPHYEAAAVRVGQSAHKVRKWVLAMTWGRRGERRGKREGGRMYTVRSLDECLLLLACANSENVVSVSGVV